MDHQAATIDANVPLESTFWENDEVCEEEDFTAEYLHDAAIKVRIT